MPLAQTSYFFTIFQSHGRMPTKNFKKKVLSVFYFLSILCGWNGSNANKLFPAVMKISSSYFRYN